ncbi:MAG: 3-oxoacyl-[acyl-carrier-protein] reductase [Alphaproteobacteria bacterium]|nr:3-oxoacyl-[acyl-carrier-protein] reductase [Alphaproteobacteria bacterium]
MFNLTGKTALITGASGGIGAAIAKILHDAGATIAISGTRQAVLEELKVQIGENVFVLPCNLSNAEDVEKLIPAAEAAMGGLDILVNNAGITKDGLAMRMKDEDWQNVIDVNLTSNFRLCRAAMRGMMKKRWGRIINITSIVGVTGNPGQANYVASKAGIIGLTKSLAQELAARNVTVNCVAPGFIATPMTDVLNDKQKEAILGRIPAGRMGGPADIAAAVVYLASEEAGYVTGQTMHVNGGMAMI